MELVEQMGVLWLGGDARGAAFLPTNSIRVRSHIFEKQNMEQARRVLPHATDVSLRNSRSIGAHSIPGRPARMAAGTCPMPLGGGL